MLKCRVVTEKIGRGWQIRIVGGNWLDPGLVMTSSGLFSTGPARIFESREAARQDIRLYNVRFGTMARVIGGLH